MAIQIQQQDVVISSLFREFPMEIKLDIFEKLVDSAYAQVAATPETWMVDGCEDAIDQIYIINSHIPSQDIHLRRFQLIRVASQINSTTRALVNRRLPRFPRYYYFTLSGRVSLSLPKATSLRHTWVCPEHDRFRLQPSTNRYNDDGDRKNTLESAILNAMGKTLEHMKHIQKALYSDNLFFHARKTEIQAIASLPNLKSICLWPGPTERPMRPAEPHLHSELQPVDPSIYFLLAQQDQIRLLSLWKPLWDAGVRITCGRHWLNEEIAEIVRTDEGLRLRFLQEECKCYEPAQSDGEGS
ncbi:hypothetical protein CGRA01v4_04700 [Colletotrichum graminicola]|uniref:Uncharacterized protein n=1 Tax=Colletotrichum graminicola (strain M1.001 / M2 / FGSC 10212) TaxID=645133 RepID=E3QLF6_COLGM|nr:uncharacterized protein GLRG_06669 [Colletotrichum graminicola M1.001]EFQ31694.1 hypothetical protein GLRG_06669 [Colletotrichum graminicola M1.001]WDK13419.1 hypothetical protein CGRA01v4_04700 [Colletotrichum graminicola]